MDCQTVRQLIELYPARGMGSRTIEAGALREHLDTCSLCQSASRDVAEWDLQLQQLMLNVEVPQGLRERLLTQLKQSPPSLAPAAVNPSQRRWRLSRWTAALALGLVGVAAVVFWVNRPGQMTLASVGDSATEMLQRRPRSDLAVFDESFSLDVADPNWRMICQQPPIGWDIDHLPGQDVAAFRISIPALRFGGWLVVVPVSRISDAPMSSAPVKLSYTQATWRDEKYVYVCVAGQGSIDQLLSVWQGGAA